MDTAEPSIDAVKFDVIRAALENVSAFFRERDFTKAELRSIRYPNKWMPGRGQFSH